MGFDLLHYFGARTVGIAGKYLLQLCAQAEAGVADTDLLLLVLARNR
jgi:hypothetical protein